jgi:hypothetical protein
VTIFTKGMGAVLKKAGDTIKSVKPTIGLKGKNQYLMDRLKNRSERMFKNKKGKK